MRAGTSALDSYKLPRGPIVPVQVICDPEVHKALRSPHIDDIYSCDVGTPWNVELPHWEARLQGHSVGEFHGRCADGEIAAPPPASVKDRPFALAKATYTR
jgi:hypothetical protein